MEKAKEQDILRTILTYLADRRDVFAWRNNTGGMTDQRGHFYHFGKVGSADILGVIQRGDVGLFLAIEVKRPGQKPTAHQQEFLHQINSHGGIGIVASSLDDVMTALHERGC